MNDDMQLIDLLHLDRRCVIGAWRVGDTIIDPGPSSCLEVLLEAIGDQPPRALLLTHIHLDHAGASGSLVRRFPDLEVWVHERGAPHLVDPSKLLASARRLYGDQMERMWGEVVPVPSQRVHALRGGERLGPLRVAYTPGHASHHVAYLHEDSGRAFTGDAAGVRIGDGYVLPPTPPPDIDLQAWRESLDVIAGWSPRSLAVTHFGAHDDVGLHLAEMRSHLELVRELARDLDEAGFAAALRAQIADSVDPDTAAAYEQAVPPEQSFQGLLRYLRAHERAAWAKRADPGRRSTPPGQRT